MRNKQWNQKDMCTKICVLATQLNSRDVDND